MSKFYDDTSVEERNDWRKHPLTEAMFAELADWRREAAETTVNQLNSERTEAAKRHAGQTEAYTKVYDHFAKEEKE